MDYSQAIAYIESLSPLPSNGGTAPSGLPGLERMALFLEELNAPQNEYPVIHIAGTNGKGSVTATVASVLQESGLKTARYIGPHLLRWNERYHINGLPISDDALASVASRARRLSEEFGKRHPHLGALTWFEFLTAMGFIYFFDQKPDCAAVEVGLGGRWDATNAVTAPLVSCIVTVGMDHMHILGSTVRKIAAEKAGIIKQEIPVVTAATGVALDVIRARAAELKAPLAVCSFKRDSYSIRVESDKHAGLERLEELVKQHTSFLFNGHYEGGRYQKQNAVVAATILGICQLRGNFVGKMPLQCFHEGLSKVYWPGRFQYLPAQRVLLDGAHNDPAAIALRTALDEKFPGPRLFVLSAYRNKDVERMFTHLLRPSDRVYASAAAVRGKRPVCSGKELVELARTQGCRARSFNSIGEAFQEALSRRTAAETIVCTGSFVTIKECLRALGFACVEDAVRASQPCIEPPMETSGSPGQGYQQASVAI